MLKLLNLGKHLTALPMTKMDPLLDILFDTGLSINTMEI